MTDAPIDPATRAGYRAQTVAAALNVIGTHRPQDAEKIADLIISTYDELMAVCAEVVAPFDLDELSPHELTAELQRRTQKLANVATRGVSMLAMDVLIIGVRGQQHREQ